MEKNDNVLKKYGANRNKVLNFRTTEEIRELLKAKAKAADSTISRYISDMIYKDLQTKTN